MPPLVLRVDSCLCSDEKSGARSAFRVQIGGFRHASELLVSQSTLEQRDATRVSPPSIIGRNERAFAELYPGRP
jgi:hypothetical protein